VKDDRIYLQHISDCISRIQEYTREGQQAFLRDTRTQDAVLRNLQVLAESARRISTSFGESHPEVPWKNIAGFRNVLVHDYLGVDLQQIWNVLATDLPDLRDKIKRVLEGT
jgi:uncharacterized protein with HEPN domain